MKLVQKIEREAATNMAANVPANRCARVTERERELTVETGADLEEFAALAARLRELASDPVRFASYAV